ncbi:MAG: hypothetical protein A2583_02210 [Bdellovibrionales bacterium RIFOXYD1_FULL_53_11]|nr:MAG: hypothetical protein A2583_02210 [Bdellovibrionales bacterium RIFOXYD1_FULL_53_11]
MFRKCGNRLKTRACPNAPRGSEKFKKNHVVKARKVRFMAVSAMLYPGNIIYISQNYYLHFP